MELTKDGCSQLCVFGYPYSLPVAVLGDEPDAPSYQIPWLPS